MHLIHEWENLLDIKAGEISKEINTVVVLKLLPEAFCNLLILKSSSWGVWKTPTRTHSDKAQNVSCSKCLGFFYFIFFSCQIFNFLSAIFCLCSCLQKVVKINLMSLFSEPSLNSFWFGVMKTGLLFLN